MTLQGVLAMAIELLGRMLPALLMLAALLLAEWRWPWRPAQRRRWLANMALGGLSFLAVLALPLASMTAAAQWATAEHFGLLNQLVMPLWLSVLLSLLALDLALYAQHRALHAGALWRLHRVHHLDPMLDVTSGVRFHPLEAMASAGYKSLVVALLGAPPEAAALSATLTLLASLFVHANIRLPMRVDQALRPLLITPALHRIHHSNVPQELRSNYGSVLSIWDRCFGSACAISPHGEQMTLGVLHHLPQTALAKMLVEPLQSPPVQ